MKRTIEIEDTLEERKDALINDVRAELLNYCEANEPDSCPDSGDLDYSGMMHGLVDGAVPVYTHEIKAAWFLYGAELEAAYQGAGIGDNPRENDGMAALYCYLEQKAQEWFSENAEEVFEEWARNRFVGQVAEKLGCTADEAAERLTEMDWAEHKWAPAYVDDALEAIQGANEAEESSSQDEV